ncbi:hypothetical protein QTP88_012001 [Uroleucon formosanum]
MSNDSSKVRKIDSFFGPSSYAIKAETETTTNKKLKVDNATENEEWEVQGNYDNSVGPGNNSSDSDDCQQTLISKTGTEIQIENVSKIGPNDITHIVSDQPTQPILKLPTIQVWKRMETIPFFSSESGNSPFYKIGFKNWKKALDKNAGIKGHNKSSIHKTFKENRYYISVIAEILLFTACQNIAQRGETRFKAEIDVLPKNAKYTHHTIQNNLFYVMSKLVLETIAKEVKEAKYFAILADETKDISKTEQLSIMVRYYHNNTMNERFLGEIKIVSDYLQKPDSDLSSSCLLVESLINYLMDLRNTPNKFEDLLKEVELCAQKNNIQLPNEKVKETRFRKLPKQFSSYLTEVATAENRKISNYNDIKTMIFFPVLDRMVNELNRRFSDNNTILTGISSLNLKSDSFLNLSNIKPLAEHYKLDIERLESELKLVTKVIKRHEVESNIQIKNILDLMQLLEKYKLAFFEMYILCTISIIIPPSSAGVERTFSSLKQIKNYMRNKMTDKRLTNIAILSIEKKIAKNLGLEVVVDKFAATHKNRRILLT